MPFAIDEEKFSKQETLDLSKPQGTTHGIPVKAIPHQEYPRAVYKHPTQDYRTIEHRNAQHEVVHTEIVPTEHKVHICADKKEMDAKLKEGWVKEPYIPAGPIDETAHLYEEAAE